MAADNLNMVYSTDSEEHRNNIDEDRDTFNRLGMYQDKNGMLCIKEELMWDGEY